MTTYTLQHPLHTENVPAVAVSLGPYREPNTARYIGLKLQFADGHTACMTYAEIRAAMAATGEPEYDA